MTDSSPITPPPDLIEDWIELAKPLPQRPPNPGELATLAARWGADQELEKCIDVISFHPGLEHPELLVEVLRAWRRPKPPSLKEQALLAIDTAVADGRLSPDVSNVVRRALKQLDDCISDLLDRLPNEDD